MNVLNFQLTEEDDLTVREIKQGILCLNKGAQEVVAMAQRDFQEVLERYGDLGTIALALVGAEIAKEPVVSDQQLLIADHHVEKED